MIHTMLKHESGIQRTRRNIAHDKAWQNGQCMTMHDNALQSYCTWPANSNAAWTMHVMSSSYWVRSWGWPLTCKAKKDGSSLIQLDFTLDLSGSRMVQELIFCILRQSSPWQVAEHLTHLQHFASLPIANWKMLESALCVLWCSARECANQGN
jgi:hypothetical protein